MYRRFFGFKEKPFKLVPNPTYLFLSKSHEDVLAHLTYAITQGDGFVKITGEIGTGKTTLCRAFLENLNDTTEAAYIFNPKLDSIELVKAINDEFGIRSGASSIKELIDTLNIFLMSQKAQGRQVVLVIDEAQNLSPAVLEQIRLLSNLETTQSKLLQIILVGQPELDQILKSPNLRQLAQRINLSCRLVPLTQKETRDYIQHRINIASWNPRVMFPQSACRAVYRYSKGIPRLVNIACDRTLLAAFGANQDSISGKITRAALRELGDTGTLRPKRMFRGTTGGLVLSMLCLFLLWVVLAPPDFLGTTDGVIVPGVPKKAIVHPVPPQPEVAKSEAPAQPAAPARPAAAAPPVSAAAAIDSVSAPLSLPEARREKPETPEPADINDFDRFLKNLDTRKTRAEAFKAVLSLWNIEAVISPDLDAVKDDQIFFRLAAKQSGLLNHRIECDLDMIKRLNLPAILEFLPIDGSEPIYLAVKKIENDRITLMGDGSEQGVSIESDRANGFWTGVTYVPWKNFLVFAGVIPKSATEDTILTLKTLMKDIGFKHLEFSPVYDERTRQAVESIQQKHGLEVDGVVGPLTKIVLYNEIDSFFKPHIRADSEPEPEPSTTQQKVIENGSSPKKL